MNDRPVGRGGLRAVKNADADAEQDDALARVDRLFAEALRLASPRSDARRTRSLMGAVLAEACGLSRANGLEPERVIIQLKATWVRMCDATFATRDEAQVALDRTITACIEQYFTESDADAARPEAPGL
jgi:hypothetical protein